MTAPRHLILAAAALAAVPGSAIAAAVADERRAITSAQVAADVQPPQLVSFDFQPRTVDVTSAAAEIRVTLRVTDETGAQRPVLSLSSDTTTQSAGFGQSVLVSGDAHDGIYQHVARIEPGQAPGPWTVVLFPLVDVLGNSGDFGPPPGFPRTLDVVSGAAPGPGATPSATPTATTTPNPPSSSPSEQPTTSPAPPVSPPPTVSPGVTPPPTSSPIPSQPTLPTSSPTPTGGPLPTAGPTAPPALAPPLRISVSPAVVRPGQPSTVCVRTLPGERVDLYAGSAPTQPATIVRSGSALDTGSLAATLACWQVRPTADTRLLARPSTGVIGRDSATVLLRVVRAGPRLRISAAPSTIRVGQASRVCVRAGSGERVTLFAATAPSRTYRAVRSGRTTGDLVCWLVRPAASTRLYAAPVGGPTSRASSPIVLTVRRVAPQPVAPPVAPPPPVPTSGPTVFYENCDAARRAGAAPIRRGEPGYRPGLDRDGDGIACE